MGRGAGPYDVQMCIKQAACQCVSLTLALFYGVPSCHLPRCSYFRLTMEIHKALLVVFGIGGTSLKLLRCSIYQFPPGPPCPFIILQNKGGMKCFVFIDQRCIIVIRYSI